MRQNTCVTLFVAATMLAVAAAQAGVSIGTSAPFVLDLQLTLNVRGRVLDADKRQPLAGVAVSLAGQNTATAADGRFALPNVSLAAGNTLTANKSGYVAYAEAVAAPPGAKETVLQDILLALTNAIPVVSQIAAKYDGIFLGKISVRNVYTATVNWNGAMPGKVQFYANDVLLADVAGAGPSYACEVDVSTAFQPALYANANTLKVVAIASGGGASMPKKRNVVLVPLPPASVKLLPFFNVEIKDDQVHAQVKWGIPDPPIKSAVKLPVIGSFGFEMSANGCFDYNVSDGAWQLAVGAGKDEKLGLAREMKLTVGCKEFAGVLAGGSKGTATGHGGIQLNEYFVKGSIAGEYKLGPYGAPDLLGPGLSMALSTIPGLSGAVKVVAVPVYCKPAVEGNVTWAANPEFSFKSAELTGKMGLEAAYEPDLGMAKMRLYVGGEPSAVFQLPEPLLKDIRFRAYAGAEFETWLFKLGPIEHVFVDKSFLKGQEVASLALEASGDGSLRCLSGVNPVAWRPLQREYLAGGSEVFVAAGGGGRAMLTSVAGSSELDAFRLMGSVPVRGAAVAGGDAAQAFDAAGVSTLSILPPTEVAPLQADVTLVANVFPSGDPAMAARSNGELMLLYVGDNGSPNTLQCTDIRWTRWNGTAWSAPASIAADTRAEFAPQVAFDGNGDAIAVWERVSDANFTTVDLMAMAARMEIAWARWSRATGTWTAPQTLTANAVLDHAPLLCGPMVNGSVMAVWTRNDANLLTGTNGVPDRVFSARWTPSAGTWSTEQTLLAAVSNRLSQSLACSTNNYAVYGWASDADGVITNGNDQEVFLCEWWSGVWGGAQRLTSNGMPDKNLRLVAAQEYFPMAVWQQGTNLVMRRGVQGTTQTVLADSGTARFADYAMTIGPAGNVALLWQEMSAKGSDAHYRIYDTSSSTWSRDTLFCADAPLERSFAPVWDALGNLTVAYNKVQVQKVTKTVSLEEGGTVSIDNVPQSGQVDLCVTKRALVRDLAILAGDFTADGGNLLPGDAVTLKAVVRNLADVAMSAPSVGFYDGNPDAGGKLISNVYLSGWFEGGATNSVQVRWVVPEPATNHTLVAVVNRTGIAAEFNPSNNVQTLAVSGKDLTVSLLNYTVETNGSLRVYAQVRNAGAPAAGSTVLAIRRCDAQGTPQPGAALATTQVPMLEPGRLAQVALDLPSGTQSGGEKFYQLRTDDAGAIADVATNNNVAVFSVYLWSDSDRDNMPDEWEIAHGLAVGNVADGEQDSDNDGLKNLLEYRNGTDPHLADTDGDGMTDRAEVEDMTDPLDPSSFNQHPIVSKRSPVVSPLTINEGASVAFSVTASDSTDPDTARRGMSNIFWYVDNVWTLETKTGAPGAITGSYTFKPDASTVRGMMSKEFTVKAVAIDRSGGITATNWTVCVNNVPAVQTIAFKALPEMALGGANLNPGATASSGLAVEYASSNLAVAQIVDGLIRVIGAGTAMITASQPGNFDFKAATPVKQTLTVKANLAAQVPSGGGTVAGAGLYVPGAKVALTAKPASNSTFLRWEDGSQAAARSLVMPNANTTVSAWFKVTTNVPSPVVAAPGPQRAMVGVLFNLPLTIASESLPTVTLTGLPSGLSYNAAAKAVIGVPAAVASNKVVTITAKNVNKTPGTNTFAISVEALPPWAQGVFSGTCALRGASVPGAASMTVTAQGKISGTLSAAGTNYAFSAVSYTNRPAFAFTGAAVAGKTSVPLAVTVTHPDTGAGGPAALARAEGRLDGATAGDPAVVLYRNVWKDAGMAAVATNYTGYYTATLPGGSEYGSGYLTFTVDKLGGVKTGGKLADGTAVSLAGTLVLDEAGRVFAVLYTSPVAYKGGGLFGLAEFFKASEGARVTMRLLDDVPFLWESRNPQATGDVDAGGFSRDVGLSGGWYDTLGNLYGYYRDRTLTVGTEGAPLPEIWVGTNRYDSVCWDPDGLALTVVTNRSDVMTGLAAPKVGAPVKPTGGAWNYDGATNAVGLTVALTRATGVFKGSFKAWFDYAATHTSKLIAYEGVLTPERENKDDGIAGRGFFLWVDKSQYLNPQGKPVPYSFSWSYELKILLSAPLQ